MEWAKLVVPVDRGTTLVVPKRDLPSSLVQKWRLSQSTLLWKVPSSRAMVTQLIQINERCDKRYSGVQAIHFHLIEALLCILETVLEWFESFADFSPSNVVVFSSK